MANIDKPDTAAISGFGKSILRWMYSFVQIPIIGLDISDQSIKYVKFSSNKKAVTMDAYGTIDVPSGIIENGTIIHEEALSTILNEWLSSTGSDFRSSFVAASLPEEQSYLRLLEVPRMKPEEVGNAIRWEIEANIPIALEDLIYDYEILDTSRGDDKHHDVVVVAFAKHIVDSYVSVLKRSGLQPSALVLESQALVRCLNIVNQTESAHIIIDIGRHRTSFVILSGYAIIFTSTIEIGGVHIEEAIRTGLKINSEDAIKIKKESGLDKRRHSGRVLVALAPILSGLSAELHRLVEYYPTHTKRNPGMSERIEKIILTGGDANLLGLDTYLASALKIPVVRMNPFSTIQDRLEYGIPPLPKSNALAFSVAIGLALRGIRE